MAIATLSGNAPSSLVACNDALTFAARVLAITVSQGRSSHRIYVTGFSEGGMLASYIAWQTGAPGVSFASCGMPGYSANAGSASNFISFVESGDPIAQYGTDTLEKGSAVQASATMDHHGIVVPLEQPDTECSHLRIPFLVIPCRKLQVAPRT